MAKFVINGAKTVRCSKSQRGQKCCPGYYGGCRYGGRRDHLENVPCIADVQAMLEIIESLGAAEMA